MTERNATVPKEVMDELDLDWYWNLVSDINNYIDKKFLKKEVPIFEKKEKQEELINMSIRNHS